jgi:hypothetical protein
LKQYGYFSIVAVPKETQTLDEARDLVLEQIELLKKGDFRIGCFLPSSMILKFRG